MSSFFFSVGNGAAVERLSLVRWTMCAKERVGRKSLYRTVVLPGGEVELKSRVS